MSNIIFAVLCLSVVLIPLPYGSVEEWSIFIFEAITFGLFALYLIADYTDRGKNLGARRSKLFYALCALIAAFFIFTLVQIVPLPAGLVRTLSPRSYEIYQTAATAGIGDASSSAAGTVSGPLTLSLSPALTSYELIKYLAYLLFAVLVYRSVHTHTRVEIFVGALLLSGLFQTIYGLTEFWGGTGRIFAWKNRYDVGSAFGTFVNRDHFSGFLEMIFPLALGYLLAKSGFFRLPKRFSLKEKILWFAQERLQKTILFGLIPVILGLGIVFSLCRTGISILVGSIFLMSLISPLSLARERDHSGLDSVHSSHRHMPKLVRAVFVVILFASLAVGLAPVIKRFTTDTLSLDRTRFIYYRNTVDLVNSFFLFGSGAGTFVHAYPLEAKVDDPSVLTHAHNDYLEMLSDSGVPAGGALILAAFGSFGILFFRWLRRRDPFVRGIGLGVLTGIFALLVHSLMDFNLRIPANAVIFLSLYALAFRILSLKRRIFLAP